MSKSKADFQGQDIYAIAASRIQKGDGDPHRKRKSLREVMGEEEYEQFQQLDADSF